MLGLACKRNKSGLVGAAGIGDVMRFFVGICLGTALFCAACSNGGGGHSGAPSGEPITPPVSYEIEGQVTGANAATVYLIAKGVQADSATIDVTGHYSFSGLSVGDYQISANAPGFEFSPNDVRISVKDANIQAPTLIASRGSDNLPQSVLDEIDALPPSSHELSEILNPDGSNVEAVLKSYGIELPNTPEELNAIAHVTRLHLQSRPQIVIPKDIAPDKVKTLVVDYMVALAKDLACGRDIKPCTKWDFEAEDPKDQKPKQQGLAYVWGDGTPGVRKQGRNDGCMLYLYGLDCSGLIAYVTSAVGITSPQGTKFMANLKGWTNLPTNISLVEVTDGSHQTGDIVLWADHVGITASTGAAADVISSTGGKGLCPTNAKPPKGPRSLSLGALSRSGLGPPTKVLRLTVSSALVHLTSDPPTLPASGGTTTLTATVTHSEDAPSEAPEPTGTVTFVDDTNLRLCDTEVPLTAGKAQCTTTLKSAPSNVTSRYSGDDHYAEAEETLTIGRSDLSGFWGGTYRYTTCTTPGYVGSGDPCAYVLVQVVTGSAGQYTGPKGLYARLGSKESNNIRYEQAFNAEICSASSGIDLASEDSWMQTVDLANVFFANSSNGTVVFSVKKRLPTEISGTFSGSFDYPIAGPIPGGPNGVSHGTLSGEWSMAPLSQAFPKCITGGAAYCSTFGKGYNYADPSAPGTGNECPWHFPSEPAPPGQWQGLQ